MGQERPLELSKEEKKELSIGLLREWWITATQAFVDSAGSEIALHFIRPHFIHSGKAGFKMFPSATGVENLADFGIMNFKRAQGCMLAAMMDGSWGPTYDADDGSGIGELQGCATKGQCKEVCAACEYLSCEAEMLDPSYEVLLTHSLARGDKSCHWLVSKKGKVPNVRPIEEFLTPPNLRLKSELVASNEVRDALSHAYLGEFWVMTTKAFVEKAGSERALERLKFYMRHSGMSLGIRLADRLKAHQRKVDSVVDLVLLIQVMHQRKGEVRKQIGTADCEIVECPFSGSPPEICLQYEAFFNGICEAIDPNYEFAYDRMMTKGNKTCHWTIRKKGEPSKEKTKEEAPSDDAVKTLTMRFARGEITEEELEKKVAHLRKLSLVK